jgi:hypothetical protein
VANISSSKFLDGLLYQAKNASAWMLAFIILSIVFIFFLVKHFNYISDDRRILVPYSVATLGDKVEYTGNFNSETNYIYLVAEADALLYANWRSEDVVNRTKRFIERLSRPARRLNEKELLNIADENEDGSIDQRAVVDGDVQISTKGRIKVPLRIERTIFDEEQDTTFAYLTFYYISEEGFPLIQKFEYEEVGRFE